MSWISEIRCVFQEGGEHNGYGKSVADLSSGKSFGTHEVLRDIDFTVNKGEAISIIGPSGSGKSTLLRCVNLLETPTGGNIYYHGKDITDAK